MKNHNKVDIKTFCLGILFSISAFSNVYARFYGDPNYGTHMVPLIAAISHPTGPILELGCGDYSTPLMHALCKPTKRYILSTETDMPWISLFFYLKSDWHEFKHVQAYKDWSLVGENKYWSVVLVDHKPVNQRIKDIERLRPFTQIFVVHDTEDKSYGYEPILATFKYRYDYKVYTPYTTLVSATIDVTLFFEYLY